MATDNHTGEPTTEQTPVATARGLLERAMAVLALRQGSFQSIAAGPSTWQSLVVALVGIALAGSIGTLVAMIFVIYPVVALLALVASGLISRYVTSKVLGHARAQGLPSYRDWVRAYMFTATPLIFGILPIVGLIVAVPYHLVLEVFSFKDMSGCSTGEGVVILLVSLALPFIVVLILLVTFGAGLLGLLSLSGL